MNMSPTPSTPTPTTNGIPTVKSNGVSKAGSKVSSTSGSMTGVLSPSPNVSVTSTGKRVAGSRGVNNHVNNNRVKELAGQQGQGQGQGLGVNFTCKTNKDGKEINLQGELRGIMHAFSDGTNPSEESVQLMELILRQEMMAFVFICDTAAYWGGSKVLGLKQGIYALRSDKPLLSRLFKYLVVKDQQIHHFRAKIHQQLNSKPAAVEKSYYAEIRGVLDELDLIAELGDLLDLHYYRDTEKTDKSKTSGGQSQTVQVGGRVGNRFVTATRLITNKYYNYAMARSVSFAKKLPQFQEWVSTYLHSEFKLNQNFMEILSFLVYELIAQIVDLSFIVQCERNPDSNPTLKFFDPRGNNPDTCMSASGSSRKDEESNNPNVSEMLVMASELEAKRLKKASSTSNRDTVPTKSVHCLNPNEIQAAYSRMQYSLCPSISFRSRAEKIKQFSFHY